MEEFENIGEQPQDVQTLQKEDTVGSPETVEEEAGKVEAERGVPVGKFKSVDELVTAYENLQAEFTRKSQKLAEVLKDKTQQKPTKEKLDDNLKEFLSKNEEAFCCADELLSRVQNQNLAEDENCFEKAWAEILSEKLSSPDKAKDPVVQNLILNNVDLQEMVIKKYVKQLSEQKIPIVMSSESGERVTKPVTPKPDSFEQAKQVVLKLFS